MPHTYDGDDPPGSPIIPTSPTSGKGVWPAAQLADDGDDRDANSAMRGVEAAHDKTNFLAHRMINVIEGSTHAYTTTIDLSNVRKQRNRVERYGTAAWLADRAPVTINGNGSGNITMTDADVFIVSKTTDSANHDFTIIPPASDVPALYRFTVRQLTDGATWTPNGKVRFNLGGGTYVFQFALTPVGKHTGCVAFLEYVAATGELCVVGSLNNVLIDQA